ncbi:MAG: lysozyme, partial [Acidobacteriota bacterium]|nr:lysozyme [Acidobacteriota bacterium]
MKPQSLINDAALELIKSFEGIVDGDRRTVNLDPYLDPVQIWTIGYGHAIRFKGAFVRGKESEIVARALYPNGITRREAENLLRQDVAKHTRELDGLLNVELNENQYGALASLIFNIGGRNLQKSTLIKLVNAEQF